MFGAITLILFFAFVILVCISSAIPSEENAGCLAYIPFFILIIVIIGLVDFIMF